MSEWEWRDVERPAVGDMALHVSGRLDARHVVRVEGAYIWLKIGSNIVGPIHFSRYTFRRLGL